MCWECARTENTAMVIMNDIVVRLHNLLECLVYFQRDRESEGERLSCSFKENYFGGFGWSLEELEES